MGRLFGELAAFIAILILIYYAYRWLEFKFKVMVRDDKENFYYRNGLQDEIKKEDSK